MTTPFLVQDIDGAPLGFYESFETQEDMALWNLQMRRRAYVQGFKIAPLSQLSSKGVTYVMGWTIFKARGETVVEWLEANMAMVERDGYGDIELWESAWRFYCLLRLTNRLRFATA